jgi:acetyl esterase/lipase
LKVKDHLKNRVERFGLFLLNLAARLGSYKKRTEAYGSHPRQVLDWYVGEGDGRPVVLFFYGGNWQSGHRSDYRFVADGLLAMGCDVVVPDYRLYPEVRFANIISDATAAFAHITCKIDAPIIVMGHSAGAQLGALLALKSSKERVSAFIGLAGPYDFFPYTEASHWDIFAPVTEYSKSQPVNFVNEKAPPFYLLHGEDDQRVRRGHSKSLMEKQRAAGGVANREVYHRMGHVDIILAFSRCHRYRSQVVADIRGFIEASKLETAS